MTYRSDRQITESLVPIKLLYTVVVNGADLSDPGNEAVRNQLVAAGADICRNLPAGKAVSLCRRAERIASLAEAPFRKAETKVSKFGLCVYYALDRLRDQGYFHIEDGTPLDLAVSALLSEDGSITEAANVEAIDSSARKQARKLFDSLQASGLYREAVWAP